MFRNTPKTAFEWVVRLYGQTPSSGDRIKFAEWLDAEPSRVDEMKSAQAAWELSRHLTALPAARESLTVSPDYKIPTAARLGGARPWIVSSAALATAAVAVICFLAFPLAPRLGKNDTARTSVGEVATYKLPDSTALTVGGDSSVQTYFAGERREVLLRHGDIYLEVTPDAQRPFVVVSQTGRIVVTGTKFEVSYADSGTINVAVVEGSINVERDSPTGEKIIEAVSAGQVVAFPNAGPSVHKKLTPQQATAWRNRMFYFDDARLSEVLQRINRYASKPLVSTNPEIDALKLSGAFNAQDIDALLVSLHELYGVDSAEYKDRWVLYRALKPISAPVNR